MRVAELLAFGALISLGIVGCSHTASRPDPSASSAPQRRSVVRNPDMRVVGDFSPTDIEAILAVVNAMDDQPVLSIVQHSDSVEVETGVVCGRLCGSGSRFVLRKVNGVWTIIDNAEWMS
jgi:hypothetical protein